MKGSPMSTNAAAMISIHDVFRTAFIDEPDSLLIATPDIARARAIGEYYVVVLDFLLAHHQAEDELVWPLLRERATDSAQIVQRAEDQHSDMHDALTAAITWAESLSAGTASNPADLHAPITALVEALGTHLDDEEATIVPLINEHLDDAEWFAVGAHASAHLGPQRALLVMGLVREHMSDPARAMQLEFLPPLVRDAWHATGANDYTALVTAARG